MSLVPGSHLGAYEILTAIDAGGMGEVYRARDRKLDRDVAIKVLPAVNRLDCSPAGAKPRISDESSPSLPLGIYFRLPLIAGIPLLKAGDYPDERSRTSCANWRSSLALRSDTAQKFV
jgi:hypothetical protein